MTHCSPGVVQLGNRGVRADAGETGDREDDVRAVVELGQREFLALFRVAEVVGIGDDHFGIRIDRLDTGAETDLIADNRRNALATDDADLVRLGEETGGDASQERGFLLLVEHRLDVRQRRRRRR